MEVRFGGRWHQYLGESRSCLCPWKIDIPKSTSRIIDSKRSCWTPPSPYHCIMKFNVICWYTNDRSLSEFRLPKFHEPAKSGFHFCYRIPSRVCCFNLEGRNSLNDRSFLFRESFNCACISWAPRKWNFKQLRTIKRTQLKLLRKRKDRSLSEFRPSKLKQHTRKL